MFIFLMSLNYLSPGAKHQALEYSIQLLPLKNTLYRMMSPDSPKILKVVEQFRSIIIKSNSISALTFDI